MIQFLRLRSKDGEYLLSLQHLAVVNLTEHWVLTTLGVKVSFEDVHALNAFLTKHGYVRDLEK